MTEGKTFKRRVRGRMSKTGESYTAARKRLAEKRDRNIAARERLAGTDDRVSDEKLKEATGKEWDAWFSLLDRWGATEKKHGEIARHLMEEYRVPGWWSQHLTVFYERARGMRLKHQRIGGGFEISATKTIAVPVDDLFNAFVDDGERKRWLPEASMTLRTAQPGRSARFDWENGPTKVVAWFETKGPSKSTVALAHQKLADAGDAETMKTYWRERLAELRHLLEA